MRTVGILALSGLLGCNRLEALGGQDAGDVVGILVTPEELVVPLGGTVQLTATGLYADRTTRDVTASVEWAIAGSGAATVSNDLDEEGLLAGVTTGEAEVTATLGDVVSNAADVRVTDAGLLGLTVEPDAVTLAEGDTLQLRAVAAWSDGTRGDAAAQVRWITGDGGVAQIASGGVLTAAGEGATAIHAEWDDVRSGDVAVEVVAGSTLADLSIAEVEGVGGGGVITLSVTVRNQGQAGASAFWVDAYLDPAGEPDFGGTGDDYALVDWVGAGGEAQVELTLYAGDGNHTVWVLADTNEGVEESDESDNTFSTSISGGSSGGGGSGGPNLEVTYFDWLADSASVYYAVDVTNSGSEDVGEFYVDVFVDRDDAPELYDDGDDFTTVAGLAAGDTEYADFLVSTGCSYCWSWVMIDGYDYVAETDEDDNVEGPLSVYADTGW